MGKEKLEKWDIVRLTEGWIQHPSIRFFMYLTLGMVMYLLLMGQAIPKTYELKQGELSPVTLYSPIRIVDQFATETEEEKAAKSIADQYTIDENIVNDQLTQLETLFNFILNIIRQEEITEQEILAEMNESGKLSPVLSDDNVKILASLSEDKIKNIKYISKSTLDSVMNDGVRLKELDQAYESVQRFVHSNPYDNQDNIKILAYEITKFFIKPNEFYNPTLTTTLREQEKLKVQPIIIKKDELVVKEGQLIDKPIYERLRATGLLKDNSNWLPYFGLLLLVSLLLLLLYFSIERMKPILHQDNVALVMIFIIFLLTLFSIKIVGISEDSLPNSPVGFLAPVAFGVMLISLLINMKLSLLSGAIFSVFVGIIFNTDQTLVFDFRYGFVALIGSAAGAFALGRINQRSAILKAGMVVAAFNFVSIFMIILLNNQIYSVESAGIALLYGVLSGIFSAVLTIGFLPFFEAVFGILSPTRLIELSNPNHPLLRKLLIETPGTYHHSIIVGNLAESAAEAVGANGLLARVGAYYHDLGKTKRPTFFIENQLNMDNPHDKISPSLSKNIIISHTRDGVELLKEHKIPKAIQDIAMQHHGTSLLRFFYHKAAKESETPISEKDYRYLGPKPQTKEAAIVSMADSIEAAVRSIKQPTNELIEETVRKIIKSKLDDGQLNECDLTLKEIEIIAISMLETLKGIFHSRIEYPEDNSLMEDKGAKTS